METLKAKGYKQFPKNGKQAEDEEAGDNEEDDNGGASVYIMQTANCLICYLWQCLY